LAKAISPLATKNSANSVIEQNLTRPENTTSNDSV
jgi:hypothetical protein